VLGSTQPLEAADAAACRRRGAEVVRRRTGGGAVLVEPAAIVWVDLVIGRDDPLWSADVGRAFLWVGAAFARALGRVGVRGVVHPGPLRRGRWSAAVCFAGLGYGEVTVGGAKVLGLAQRRSRDAALFQCAVPLRWRPADLVALLAEPRPAAADLEGAALGLGEVAPAVTEASVVEALLDALPA